MPPDPSRGSRFRRSYLKAPLNKYSCQYEHPSKNLSYAPDYLYRHSVLTSKSSTTRSISSRFIRRFVRTWIYPFTFTEFKLFPLHLQSYPLGFEKEELFIVPIRIFSFARRYANFPYNVFDRRHKFTSGHPSLHQKKKNKQTTATNNEDK